MFRKRNLAALLMAAMLSLGTMGVAMANDSSSARYGDDHAATSEVVSDAAN